MKIADVAQNSIAAELGIVAGDDLVAVNGRPVRDIIDYNYHLPESGLLLLLDSPSGEYEAEIEKEPYEDIGLSFSDEFGRKIVCRNNCLFCFVDQLPKNMRRSLYFKDDDWRMSFLMGSYITLTNLSEDEIERIIEQKISPLYVSVHASDAAVRQKLLGSEKAAGTLEVMKRLVENGIRLHAQVVMCPGINDGIVLERTMEDLYALYPGVASLAVVPVGLTAYRESCYPLCAVDRQAGERAITLIEDFQQRALREADTRFVWASDELYLRTGRGLPAYEAYESFDQLENGVGLVAKFVREAEEALEAVEVKRGNTAKYAIATGADFYPYMQSLAGKIMERLAVHVQVYCVENVFFGNCVTVTGLLTGGDIIRTLGGKIKEDVLLLSASCFMEREDVMLDDITLDDLQKSLGVPCRIVRPDGYALIGEMTETERN